MQILGWVKKSQKTGDVVCEQPQSENFHCSVLTLVGKLCIQAQNHKNKLSAESCIIGHSFQ